MIVRKANKVFLKSFSELSVRFFVKDKKEHCTLVGSAETNGLEIAPCVFDIGESAVDFLYDSLFERGRSLTPIADIFSLPNLAKASSTKEGSCFT